jgi:hypothetical protein
MARDVREHGRFCLKHRNLTEITYLLQYIFSAYLKVVLYIGTTVDRWKDGQWTVASARRVGMEDGSAHRNGYVVRRDCRND